MGILSRSARHRATIPFFRTSVLSGVLSLVLALWCVEATAAESRRPFPLVDQEEALSVRGDVERSLWISSPEDIVYGIGTAKQDLFSFCLRPRAAGDPALTPLAIRPMTHLFVNARTFVTGAQEDIQQLRAFLREAHRRGLHVDYIDGEALWINKGAGEANMVTNALARFQGEGADEERFDAVTLHVEPYKLRGWFSPVLWGQYVAFIRMMRGKFAASHTPFGVTIPRWYDQTPGVAGLLDVYALVEHVVVLDYVDQDRPLVESISTEIALGDSLHVRVYAGIETRSNVITSASFCDAGWVPMEEGLMRVNDAYAADPWYMGVVISDYESFRTMRRTAHALDFAAQGVLPTIDPTVAEMVVLDNPGDPKLTRAEIQRLQYFNGHYRHVLARVPASTIVTLTAHPGAGPFTPLALWTADVCANDTKLVTQGVGRLLKLGIDGFVVDLHPILHPNGEADPVTTRRAVVDALTTLARVARVEGNKPGAPILLWSAQRFVRELDADLYERLAGIADGVRACVKPG